MGKDTLIDTKRLEEVLKRVETGETTYHDANYLLNLIDFLLSLIEDLGRMLKGGGDDFGEE